MPTETSPLQTTHDVAVVGGGAAGLSAAIALARSLRSVVLVDAGSPRNAPAAGAHNVLGREGVAPLELLAAGRREAEAYGVEIRDDVVRTVGPVGAGFELGLRAGPSLRVRRVILATGLVDELPDLPGVRELWGRSVLHCPYCHGYEVRGRRIGVLATSPMSVHQSLLFRQLSDRVTVLEHVRGVLDEAAREQLAALGIDVVAGPVTDLVSAAGELRGVALAGGGELALDALVVAPRFSARGDLYQQLGGTLTDHPMGGTFIETDPMGRTAVPGVWAAGNSRDLQAMVSAASADGVRAGAAVNADLVAEEAAAAVSTRS